MIETLHSHNIRNLGQAKQGQIKLNLAPCNVFIGANGSGKTSVLESVFLLARGKTFRHHQPKHYINHSKDSCTVFAKVANQSFAIAKDRHAKTELRHNQRTVQSQAILTQQLPTLLIDPSLMGVLEDRTEHRRQLLDWLCFHSNANFYKAWLNHQKLLKQRNALLKSPKPLSQIITQLTAWDKQLSIAAQQLHQSRLEQFNRWQASFDNAIALLLPQYHGKLTLSYQAGFDTHSELATLLTDRLASDKELGYTRIGAHRADIHINIDRPDTNKNKFTAVNVLSRGEKKLLITALKLAQLPLVCTTHNACTPLVLIDDISSELDSNAINRLLTTLASLPCQLFITSLDEAILTQLHAFDPQIFNINNGAVVPML